jgi:hypothetical protein
MNGVHDMGGMHGMGPVVIEPNEPVFHESWEARVFALRRAMGAWGKWNIDATRHSIELVRRTLASRQSQATSRAGRSSRPPPAAARSRCTKPARRRNAPRRSNSFSPSMTSRHSNPNEVPTD